MPTKLTQEEFVARARKVHGNKYDYSKSRYIDKRTPVTIVCPIHGEFQQYPRTHYLGHGCLKCGNKSQSVKISKPHYDFEEFKRRSNIVHGHKYEYISDKEYKGIKTKVHIRCLTCGNEFYQVGSDHLNGRGCPACKARKSSELQKGKPQFEQRTTICGIGINDYEGSTVGLKSYHIWREIIARCYGDYGLSRRPTYKDCEVCESWLFFSNFKEWYDEFCIDGFDVDKDLLSASNNKIYSPQTCTFLPPEINAFLIKESGDKNNSVGVFKTKTSFVVSCGGVYLGVFKNLEEAKTAYLKEKQRQVIYLSEKWKSKIEERAYNALINLNIREYFNL